MFNLTARGPAEGWEALAEGLRFGHDALVHSFKELTSAKAHECWEIIDDDVESA